MIRVREVQIPYGKPVTVQIPKRTVFLKLLCPIDANNANIKPRIVYGEDSAFPQLTEASYILLRGQCDVEAEGCKPNDFEFVDIGYDANRRISGIATLWRCSTIKDVPKQESAPAKPRQITPPSPESLAAIAAHEAKIRAEEERLAKIKEDAELNTEEMQSTETVEVFGKTVEDTEAPELEAEASTFTATATLTPEPKKRGRPRKS